MATRETNTTAAPAAKRPPAPARPGTIPVEIELPNHARPELTGEGLGSQVMPVSRRSVLLDPGYMVWCGAIARHGGRYYLLYSRWPEAKGHHAWVTDSEIAVASSASSTGPWTTEGVVLPAAGGTAWDRDVTHNPAVLEHEGKYYLYYMGNFGNGEYWNNRNNQRVGLAVADDPRGPWVRRPEPLLDVRPGKFDALVTSNPTVCRGPDGRFCMLYKAVGEGPRPKGGAVVCGVAFADHPEGPWERLDAPVISNPDHPWAVEDPCLWSQDGRYYAIVKDFQGYFVGGEKNVLVLLTSEDAVDWRPAGSPLFMRRRLNWEGGEVAELDALERPQWLMEGGLPTVLSAACATDTERKHSFNVQMQMRLSSFTAGRSQA